MLCGSHSRDDAAFWNAFPLHEGLSWHDTIFLSTTCSHLTTCCTSCELQSRQHCWSTIAPQQPIPSHHVRKLSAVALCELPPRDGAPCAQHFRTLALFARSSLAQDHVLEHRMFIFDNVHHDLIRTRTVGRTQCKDGWSAGAQWHLHIQSSSPGLKAFSAEAFHGVPNLPFTSLPLSGARLAGPPNTCSFAA